MVPRAARSGREIGDGRRCERPAPLRRDEPPCAGGGGQAGFEGVGFGSGDAVGVGRADAGANDGVAGAEHVGGVCAGRPPGEGVRAELPPGPPAFQVAVVGEGEDFSAAAGRSRVEGVDEVVGHRQVADAEEVGDAGRGLPRVRRGS